MRPVKRLIGLIELIKEKQNISEVVKCQRPETGDHSLASGLNYYIFIICPSINAINSINPINPQLFMTSPH